MSIEEELTLLRRELEQAQSMVEACERDMREWQLTGMENDGGLPASEQEICQIKKAVWERKKKNLQMAIERLEAGEDGSKCSRCGGDIDPERRKIFPETLLCVRCASGKRFGK